VAVSDDEVKYLLQAVERTFPAVKQARILRAWAGVRPTLFAYGPLEDKLSRDHEIHDHGAAGAEGLLSIIGGKLASFRAMSEEAVDLVCKKLGKGAECQTHRVPLPGGEREATDAAKLAREHGVASFAAARLAYRHGAEAEAVLALAEHRPELRAQACSCEGITLAELSFSMKHELADGLTDLRRRCRLAMGVCQGARCTAPAAALWADEKGATASRALQEAEKLLDERWKGNRPVIAGDGLAQAELTRGAYLTTGNLASAGGRPWR
jgi:glycerol-3-phosphate dehydrogenase